MRAYYIDAGYPALLVADQITYWFGLFTHQRVSHLWKGILQLPLLSDDKDAAKRGVLWHTIGTRMASNRHLSTPDHTAK